ncbi:VCBS repeat-containing protein, partial [candidate division WOR-3 bacterium]|nr:VCBS repeat-containing protein [candidate division WOR-3 bacterium]
MLKKALFSILCIVLISFAGNDCVWIETTQADFADGIYERNIYASHLDGGTIEFAPRFDLNNDGYIDLITSDNSGPYVKVYWGSVNGYNQQNVRLFPINRGGGCTSADLNNDGFNDLLVTNWCEGKFTIYWGNETGPNPSDYISFYIGGINTEACYVADFDKDGFLDIVVGENGSNNLMIFWGSSQGYSSQNYLELPGNEPAHNLEVADLNHDGWLDIIFVNKYSTNNCIYWNSEIGFNPAHKTDLPFSGSDRHGCSIADLNTDGYLDIIFTGYYQITQSYIYWGSENGYSVSNYQILIPGRCYGGASVYDFNDDNYLDILYIRGSSYAPNEKPIIYWGSETGFSDANRIEIGDLYLYASGGLVADLNYDGMVDVFLNNYESQSYIFWGPEFSNYTSLPVNLDHHGMFREIGNVYNREYYEDYISSVFDAAGITDWGVIEWDVSLPCATSMLFWVRSGDSPTPDTSWSDWYSVCNGDSIPDNLNARYLQYKAQLAF